MSLQSAGCRQSRLTEWYSHERVFEGVAPHFLIFFQLLLSLQDFVAALVLSHSFASWYFFLSPLPRRRGLPIHVHLPIPRHLPIPKCAPANTFAFFKLQRPVWGTLGHVKMFYRILVIPNMERVIQGVGEYKLKVPNCKIQCPRLQRCAMMYCFSSGLRNPTSLHAPFRMVRLATCWLLDWHLC
jgi:hypothetical protein